VVASSYAGSIPSACARYHPSWLPGQAEIAAGGGADRRSAKNASAGMNQSREAHLAERSLHSPEGGQRMAWRKGYLFATS
jgi:hypothetical protein